MSDQKKGEKIRTILLFLLLVGFTILVTSRFTNAANLLKTLARGKWPWVIGLLFLRRVTSRL